MGRDSCKNVLEYDTNKLKYGTGEDFRKCAWIGIGNAHVVQKSRGPMHRVAPKNCRAMSRPAHKTRGACHTLALPPAETHRETRVVSQPGRTD